MCSGFAVAIIRQHLDGLAPLSVPAKRGCGISPGAEYGSRNPGLRQPLIKGLQTFDTMQPFSTASSGSLFSIVVAFSVFLIVVTLVLDNQVRLASVDQESGMIAVSHSLH